MDKRVAQVIQYSCLGHLSVVALVRIYPPGPAAFVLMTAADQWATVSRLCRPDIARPLNTPAPISMVRHWRPASTGRPPVNIGEGNSRLRTNARLFARSRVAIDDYHMPGVRRSARLSAHRCCRPASISYLPLVARQAPPGIFVPIWSPRPRRKAARRGPSLPTFTAYPARNSWS